MKVNRGNNINTTSGNRKVIFCEGEAESIDIIFYKSILGINANKFEFKALGSSNILLSYAETKLISNGFCLVDRDFRTDEESLKLENKFSIKFLKVHEVENFLLNVNYLSKLNYLRKNIDIQKSIDNVISEKRIRFLADFLQFKINNHLGKFPRISKLRNSELTIEEDLVNILFSKLDNNYEKVESKINEIKSHLVKIWKDDFDNLTIDLLSGKEIFKELKNKIFINPPNDSDIAKDIALLMRSDEFFPEELNSIFIN